MASSDSAPPADTNAFEGWPAVLSELIAGRELTRETARRAMALILAGEATDAQIAGFVIGLAGKGETTPEILGLRDAMLEACNALTLPDDAIDIVGVGGAPRRQVAAFNVSTISSFVASAAGATVCKHGNRRASSTSGSFDLLERLGANIEQAPDHVERCVRDVGVGFAYARAHHPAMRHVGPARTQLGVPTVFNVLGPVSHPGQVRRQLVGVPDRARAEQVADVLAGTEPELVWIVHGHDDLDELSLTGPTDVIEVRGANLRRFVVDGAEYGLPQVDGTAIAGGDADVNARIVGEIFAGERSANRDMIVLNAGAALVVAGVADDLGAGLAIAAAAIDDGGAASKLAEYIAASQG